MRFRPLLLPSLLSLALTACESSSPEVTTETSDSPTNAEAIPIVSTGSDELRDLIRPGDPSAFVCVVDLGVGPGEFYDKDSDTLLFPERTHFFEARYDDGATVEIRVHPDLLIGTEPANQATRIAAPIGLLPTELRVGIERVGFLDGDSSAQADGNGEGIHVYERNVAVREAANRFEETLFHESVHTSLDDTYAQSAEWLTAQSADDSFLTEYASEEPETEDLAETALYAWALRHHPDRVSMADATAWQSMIPNRLAFIDTILSPPGEGSGVTSPSC